MATTTPRESETVSFRLSGASLAKLSEDAEARGISRGEYARNIVLSVLQDENRLQVLEESRAVRDDVHKLRADVAVTLEAVLLNIGRIDPAQVQAFVSKNLRD